MQKACRRLLVISALLAAFFSVEQRAYSQVAIATVTHNVNLRPDPSSSQPAIRLLAPSEELKVMSLEKVNGYYNVATDQGQQGWAYGAYIAIDNSNQAGTVERNTNLRSDPSSSNNPIRLLSVGEQVTLLELAQTNSYYHVSTTAGEQGWAYAPNISPVPIAPPSTPTSPTVSAFPDAHDPPPSGWSGPVFRLSQQYPTTQPSAGQLPWKQFDFKTQGEQYVRAVLQYAMEGNIVADWDGARNQVRKWYHTPWLHVTSSGREFVHGLTRERSSRPRELHANQSSTFANYAVGLYNPLGGYVIGRVWRDPENPDPSAARFPDGAVAVKLLFTTATVTEVPYLKNSLEWDAHISDTGTSTSRTIQKVRLLQIDVAVRDTRADSTTGWVFGTFVYNGDAPGTTVWDRMIPVGVTWGNDPTLTPTAYSGGSRTTESSILNTQIGPPQHLGWLGRLNGPVDNPRSACLSCHATAEHEQVSGAVPGNNLTDTQKMRWFRNIPSGTAFDTGQQSLDYSLQLALGVKNFFDNRQAPIR